MSKAKRLFLVGQSGAGKGVLGDAIAKKLNWDCVNMDYAMEPAIGRSMDDILGVQGKKQFSSTLTEMLSYQVTKDNIVVVTDDSIVFSKEARDILKNEFTVFVGVSLEVQHNRLAPSRPLLPVEDYLTYLQTLKPKRDEYYKDIASFSLSSDNGDIDSHVNEVISAFEETN